jgi:hypothetical protein
MKTVPVHEARPDTDRSYLVFCPDHGGWHVGQWWTIDGPGRWVLAFDVEIELTPSHVLHVPTDPLDKTGIMQWVLAQQIPPSGED